MKNLKMFAIALLAMLVMVSGVHAAEENPCKDATGNTAVYAKINGNGACFATVSAALTAANTSGALQAEQGTTVEITLYADIATDGSSFPLVDGVNYVIDLNGKKVGGTTAISQTLTVQSNQTLTIKGEGTITASNTLIELPAASSSAKVVIEKGVTLNVTGGTTGAIKVAGANELNVAGTVKYAGTSAAAIVVDGSNGASVVNFSGDLTSTHEDGISVKDAATLNITGGTIKAVTASKAAVRLDSTDGSNLPTLKVSGGELTVASKAAAVVFTTTYANEILEANKGNITGGVFKYALVKDIAVGAGEKPISDILSILVGEGSSYEIASNGTVTVTAKATQEPEPQQPGTIEPGTTGDGNQGGTDNVQNPNTNDNILVYAGLGLVSLASVAFTAKKRED